MITSNSIFIARRGSIRFLRNHSPCTGLGEVLSLAKDILIAILILITCSSLNAGNLNRPTQEQIKTFINLQAKHDPNNLPSSCQLFFDQKPSALIWSILIPTLVERSEQFEQIFTKLLNQIIQENLQEQIEIVFYRDDRDATVGYKRNQLISNASGKYTCFVDDDDDVSNKYIKLIYKALLQDRDCVKLIGIYSENYYKQPFIHSIAYNSWFEANRVYYRPPNHLNPIKREISSKFQFPNYMNHGEDMDWSMQICRANAIKSEANILEPYYFYIFDPKKSVSLQRINEK